MKTREEILKLYQEHFGKNHEAGVFAVYDAGLADGRAVDAPKEKPTPTPVVSTGTATSTLIGTGTSTAIPVSGKPQPRQ